MAQVIMAHPCFRVFWHQLDTISSIIFLSLTLIYRNPPVGAKLFLGINTL